jgi:hypothetical protein
MNAVLFLFISIQKLLFRHMINLTKTLIKEDFYENQIEDNKILTFLLLVIYENNSLVLNQSFYSFVQHRKSTHQDSLNCLNAENMDSHSSLNILLLVFDSLDEQVDP